MEYWFTVLVGLIVCFVLWKIRNRKLPPGPWGVPILGYIPFLSKKPHLDLLRLAKKYGNIFSIRLGSHYIVVLNDYQSTKEAFTRPEMIGRPPEFFSEMNDITKKTGAIMGPAWIEQRRFVLHMLRDLGFGKTKMEGHIQEEIEELLEHFEKKGGKPFFPRNLLASSMSNNIASLVFGKRLRYDEPVRKMLNSFVLESTDRASQTSWKLFFPWLRDLLNFLGFGKFDVANNLTKQAQAYFMKEIEEHERTLNPENIRDVIDGYLLEMKKRKDEPAFNKLVLQDIVGAFFGAGSETVRTSVEWLILIVAQYPESQRRIQAEIDDVIGRNRMSIYTDHQQMPYTDSFIMEMLRWKTLLPINLLRYTLSDTELGGYFLPKHTQILQNLWAIHHDAEYWGSDVEEFRPERFLTNDQKTVKKIERYVPFSTGKRACPGEPLAKIEIFLYFTAILQKFNIRYPDGKQADFEALPGITAKPKTQDIIMTKRDL